jgi:hypothetical protein
LLAIAINGRIAINRLSATREGSKINCATQSKVLWAAIGALLLYTRTSDIAANFEEDEIQWRAEELGRKTPKGTHGY